MEKEERERRESEFKKIKKLWKRVLLGFVVLIAGSVLFFPDNSTPESRAAEAAVSNLAAASDAVIWSNYSATVKERIDTLASQSNCDDLLKELSIAEGNSIATFNRTGTDNSALTDYIALQWSGAGCDK